MHDNIAVIFDTVRQSLYVKTEAKEFAVQSIMGMEQKPLAGFSFAETLIMGIFSILIWYFLRVYFALNSLPQCSLLLMESLMKSHGHYSRIPFC